MTSQLGKQTIAMHILPIFHKVKAVRQGNFVSLQNITREILFLKNQTQDVVEKLFPDPFPKS